MRYSAVPGGDVLDDVVRDDAVLDEAVLDAELGGAVDGEYGEVEALQNPRERFVSY